MKKLLCLFCVLFLLCACSKRPARTDYRAHIHEIDDSSAEEFSFDVHSSSYLLIRLNDMKVLYEKGSRERIYPASLTKVFTMNTTLKNVNDIHETSYLTSRQYWDLIAENASVAYLDTDEDYTIEDLLYALILPSGADAAVAIGNYFSDQGLDLIQEINANAKKTGLTDSHFTNPTGLHDDDLYTSVEDILLITLDTLSDDTGRKVLETLSYYTEDGIYCRSTVSPLINDDVDILGGKTGFTGQAGQNILVLFRYDHRSYLLILTGAHGDPSRGQYYHYEDVRTILERLFDDR